MQNSRIPLSPFECEHDFQKSTEMKMSDRCLLSDFQELMTKLSTFFTNLPVHAISLAFGNSAVISAKL